MSWKNISLIFHREVRDQLRDRRTLFMVAVLPLLLYPALGIGMMQMTVLFSEQPRTVVIVGTEGLPATPPLIEGDRFVSNWFKLPQDAEKLVVVTDDAEAEAGERAAARRSTLLNQAAKIQAKRSERIELESQLKQAVEENDADLATDLQRQIDDVKSDLSGLFADSKMQVLIIIPQDFGANIEEVNRQLAERNLTGEDSREQPRPIIVRNSADEKSLIAYRRVQEAIQAWEQSILKQRLDMADLPESLSNPVNPDFDDLAMKQQLEASLWSKLFPSLLIIMAVTGAFYPAVDLAAGEKERGTMETLLICPASRTDIVVGKFFTVVLFSMSTAILNLLSMGMTGKYMISLSGSGRLADVGNISFPSMSALWWLLLLMIPLAALFSALCLALATFARSSKEGQYYLTPLLMVTMGLTVFCLSPAVELNAFYSVMPIVGIALLLKGQLLGNISPLYVIPVLITSIGYSLLALWWAIEQFKSEDVLFREAERFDLRLWLKHLLRDKEATPTFAEAGFCFVMIMLMQFGSLKILGQAFAGATGTEVLRLLMIQQLVIIASPALFMGVMLTTRPRTTFRLKMPRWDLLGVAALLPFVLHPLSVELLASLDWFFPPLPDQMKQAMATMADQNESLWFVLLAFAVAPGICEELAFRGFILSGFERSGKMWLAIVLSSVTFGIMHMIPQQVFNATLLGLVLGLIAIRSNSLLPGVVFHFIYNSLGVLHGRVGAGWIGDSAAKIFFRNDQGSLRYQWPLLIVCAIFAIVFLRRVANANSMPSPKQTDSSPDDDETEPDAEEVVAQQSHVEMR